MFLATEVFEFKELNLVLNNADGLKFHNVERCPEFYGRQSVIMSDLQGHRH